MHYWCGYNIQSKNSIPDTFLRGIGVPNDLILYIRSLKNNIHYFSCFISYASKDQIFTKRLHSDLQNNGVRCWFAPENLKVEKS